MNLRRSLLLRSLLRRFLFFLFALALSPSPPLVAQSLAKTFTLNAANQNACIGTSGLPTVGIYVSGTFSLTLQPQTSINGSAPQNSQVTPTSSSTAQSTITTAGNYVAGVGGFDTFCLKVSTYASGSVTVVLNPSPALNAGLLSGGGNGFAGLNITTASSPNIPAALYSPSETPASANPYIFSQDVNGKWHTQAVIDTQTANGGTGSGPADPAGTLAWTRRQYFRDSLTSTQTGKNAFLSVNHNSGVGTLQTNQDRALWISQGNASGAIFNFSIASNVVTFGVTLDSASYPWGIGQIIIPEGLSTGTYLNGESLTITNVAPDAANFFVSAAFTHANVSSTSDVGTLDLLMYSMEPIQAELDLYGSPQALGFPDSEYRTLSLQCSDNTFGTVIESPAQGFGCLRASYSRAQSSTGGNIINSTNGIFNMSNLSSTGTQGETWVNLLISYDDTSGGPAPQTSYIGQHFTAAPTAAFSRNNFAQQFANWPTKTHGTFNDWIQLFGTGEIYYDGTHTVETADMAGQATVLATTTSIAVTFAINYIGTAAPVVNLTPVATSGTLAAIQTVLASGGPVVIYTGSANAWTGFSINIPVAAPTGGLTFNYTVAGTF